MPKMSWNYRPSGLGVREDNLSWQGSCQSEPLVFFRRSKDDTNTITDLLIGNLTEPEAAVLFAEFISVTGGVDVDRLILSAIGRRDDDNENTLETYDGVIAVAKSAIGILGRQVTNAFLDDDHGLWNAVVEFGPQLTMQSKAIH